MRLNGKRLKIFKPTQKSQRMGNKFLCIWLWKCP